MSHLALHCNPAGRIIQVFCDDAVILGNCQGMMLSTAMIPSGVAQFFELLGHLEEHEVVCGWMLELGSQDDPTVLHVSAARDDDYVLILGTDAPLRGQTLAERIPAADGRARALARQIAEREADTAAVMDDLRAQVKALAYQAKSPIKMENELLRMAAHDLRNPLLVVSMNCSFLLHDCNTLSDEQRALLSDAMETSEFMTRYLDGMTSLAQVWVGKLELERELLDLDALVRYLVERNASSAARRHITIELARTEPVAVEADRRRVTQVINQLFSNVMKFCPAGSVARVALDKGPGEAVLVIEDNGPGITPENKRNLFRPFGKTHAHTTSPADYGAGVGLVIARRLIEAHRGRIEVESRDKEGTRVALILPLAEKG